MLGHGDKVWIDQKFRDFNVAYDEFFAKKIYKEIKSSANNAFAVANNANTIVCSMQAHATDTLKRLFQMMVDIKESVLYFQGDRSIIVNEIGMVFSRVQTLSTNLHGHFGKLMETL